MAFTDRYDEQVRTAINGRLRGAGKRLSAYCASVVDGEDIDSLADDFAAGVDDSVDDGVSDACYVAVAMCLALSGEASRRKKKPVGKSLITAAGAAALSAYLLHDDRVRAKDIMKGFASQTKEAVSLLPDGTKEERARRLAEYLKNPSRIVADAGEESIIHKQPAIISRLRRAITTEIATAYRVVEHSIWNILPFVVGQEIRLGKKHPVPDICDDLQGIYPKDFKFTGWHPWCRCFARPIFSWESDKVTDMPENFDVWLQQNAERVDRAAERGTLPVWIRENKKYVKDTISQSFKTNAKLYDERKKQYQKYLDDPDYKDVEFNEENAGVKATHKEHKFHENDNKRYFPEQLTGDELEIEFQNVAFGKGHSVIFRAEAENATDLDMFLDDVKMDLVSVTENSTIFKNQLKRKNRQLRDFNDLYNEDNESLCMYFHDPSFYAENKVRQGINKLKEYGANVKIKYVYVMLNNDTEMIKLLIE